jgi:hypothetical protein
MQINGDNGYKTHDDNGAAYETVLTHLKTPLKLPEMGRTGTELESLSPVPISRYAILNAQHYRAGKFASYPEIGQDPRSPAKFRPDPIEGSIEYIH